MEADLFALLEKRCGSEEKAAATLEEISLELGLGSKEPTNSLAALALIRLGHDGEKVASLLRWNEFEDLCAKLLSSSGYEVRRNIVLTKPRKQIDLFAASSLISLSVDCKHYTKWISSYSLVKFAEDQLERTLLYKERRGHRGPVLPMILTLFEASTTVVEGVPVVPLLKLRNFLHSVNPYDGLAVV
jgi:hypothetical protein